MSASPIQSEFRHLVSTSMLAAAAAMLVACGGGSHPHHPPPPPPPPSGVLYDVIQLIEDADADIRVSARGLNEADQVAGTIFAGDDAPSRAFLYNGKRTIDLGDFGGRTAQAYAINRCGHVTGWAEGAVPNITQAYLYDGTLRPIGDPSRSSWPYAISNCDQITGFASFNGQTHAFLYDGTLRDLGTLGGGFSVGNDINDSGVVLGSSTLPGPLPQVLRAFIYDRRSGAGLQDIGTLGGDYTDAVDLNNAGQATGTALTAAGLRRAFRYSGGALQDLGTLDGPGGFSTVGQIINEAGWVIGTDGARDGRETGFLHDGTRMYAVMLPGERISRARALNNKGVVVGSSSGPSGTRAISWTIAGGGVDLNTRLYAPPPGLVLTEAQAINDKGSIVALANTGLVLLRERR